MVEDDPEIRRLVRGLLERASYTVLDAGQGSDALRIAVGHPGPIHLLLSDVVMPGIGGRELLEHLASLRPGLRVLYVSGHTDDAILRHGVQQSKVAFLQKPFTVAALMTKVREVLDE